MRNAKASMADILDWIEAGGMGSNGRYAKSAISKLGHSNELQTLDAAKVLDDLEHGRENPFEAKGLEEKTQQDYQRRTIRAIKAFFNDEQRDRQAVSPHTGGSQQGNRSASLRVAGTEERQAIAPGLTVSTEPMSPDEQIAQALSAIAKWPDLWEFLLPGIIQAKQSFRPKLE